MRTLAPSSANSWVACPAYEGDRTSQDTDAANEGVAAAWVADMVLKNDAGDCLDMLGETAPNGYDITPDIVENVQVYVDYVRSVAGVDFKASEHDVSIPEVGISGRTDTVIFSDRTTLEIIDYKNGYRIVEPEDSWQLICYAAGMFTNKVQLVKLTIVQPRPHHPDGPVRSITYSKAAFDKLVTRLYEAAMDAQEPDPVQKPGKPCSRCVHRNNCPALSENIYAGLEVLTTTDSARPYTALELSREYDLVTRMLKMLENKHSGLEAELNARMDTGEYIPGYVRAPGQTRRYISSPPSVIQLLTSVDPMKQVPKTLKELEQEGVTKQQIELFTSKTNTYKIQKFNQKSIDRMFKK